MIDDMLASRFETPGDLDAWLHSGSIVLDGGTPFERLALGDGDSVLIALGLGHEGVAEVRRGQGHRLACWRST